MGSVGFGKSQSSKLYHSSDASGDSYYSIQNNLRCNKVSIDYQPPNDLDDLVVGR